MEQTCNKHYRTLQLFQSFDICLQVLLPMPVPLLPIPFLTLVTFLCSPYGLLYLFCNIVFLTSSSSSSGFQLRRWSNKDMHFKLLISFVPGTARHACILYIYRYIYIHNYKTNSSKVDCYSSETIG